MNINSTSFISNGNTQVIAESMAALLGRDHPAFMNNVDDSTIKAVIDHGEFQSREELERFLYQRNEISNIQ